MRPGRAMRIHTYENDLFNGEDAHFGYLIAYFTPQRKRGTAKVHSFNAQLYNIALFGRTNKVDLTHVFGNTMVSAQLDNGVNGCFLINPAEQTSAKQRTMCVQVLGFYPFPC